MATLGLQNNTVKMLPSCYQGAAKRSPGGIQYLVTQYPDTGGPQRAKYREIDQGGVYVWLERKRTKYQRLTTS